MNYESWRISYQSSEQAARAAYRMWQELEASGAGGVEPLRKLENELRVIEAAKRLVDHADCRLGGVLSADSKAREIPSRAISQVKARHLASLRDALTDQPAQAQEDAAQAQAVPIAWIDSDTLDAMKKTPASAKTRWPIYRLSEWHEKDGMTGLYLHPVAPVRQPLTDKQIDDIRIRRNKAWSETFANGNGFFDISQEDYREAFRDAERHYGITKEQT